MKIYRGLLIGIVVTGGLASCGSQPSEGGSGFGAQPVAGNGLTISNDSSDVVVTTTTTTTTTSIIDAPAGETAATAATVAQDQAVNSWIVLAAAQEAGLPANAACAYPATIPIGQMATISCPIVNLDASQGSWTFAISSDNELQAPPSYAETTPAPTTAPPTTQPLPPITAPPTLPPIQPAVQLTDPHFGTCKEAKANGYGPYRSGQDPEYGWYRDADSDGVVCE